MGLFDVFGKRKKPEYDPTNISVKDLKKGFVFEYDLRSWEVVEAYEYDWGGHSFSYEYKIFDGSEYRYLSVEQDDDLVLTLSKKVRIRTIDSDLPEFIERHEEAPRKLHYEGMEFLLEGESPGYFRNMEDKTEEAAELISWDYYNKAETHCICIEQWGDREFEASYGQYIKAFEISNILPK